MDVTSHGHGDMDISIWMSWTCYNVSCYMPMNIMIMSMNKLMLLCDNVLCHAT